MKNNKIKFRLEVWETIVLFQILEMDERFRSKSDFKCAVRTKTNYFDVQSVWNIELSNDCIALRGMFKEDDFNVARYKASTKKEALEYKEKVIQSLKYWAENWEGFKEEDKKEDESGVVNPNIYEF